MHNAAKFHSNQRNRLRLLNPVTGDINVKTQHLLEIATLAPSTHNTQPWQLTTEDNKVSIYADYKKRIPEADPVDKYLLMSIGALIKNIELVATSYGLEVISVKTDANHEENQPIAEVKIKMSKNNLKINDRDLLDAVISRQNYRGFFTNQSVNSSLSKIIKGIPKSDITISFTDNQGDIDKLANLTANGLRSAYQNQNFRQEIASLINHNLSRKRHGLHGYSLRMKLLPSLIIPKVMKHKDIGEKLAKLNHASFLSAQSVVLLSGVDKKQAWLKCGQVLQELLVDITQAGLTSSIFVASIETAHGRSEVSKIFQINSNEKPQILFCVGKGADVMPYSARRNIKKSYR